jgi:hypothetical protein
MADRPMPDGNIDSSHMLDIRKEKHVLAGACFSFLVPENIKRLQASLPDSLLNVY